MKQNYYPSLLHADQILWQELDLQLKKDVEKVE